VAIEAVSPEVDGGRFPSKRSLGERVAIEADVFGDGHDAIACVMRYRHQSESGWTEVPMVALGNDCGVNTRALLTNMDTPLGRAAGNWLEVRESVACLDSKRDPGDLRELVLACATQLLVQTRKAKTIRAARQEAEACLSSGQPRRKWDEMLVAQGADLTAFNQKLALDRTAPAVVELKAPRAGFVCRCDARIIGEVIRDLGGGRLAKDSVINYDVGVDQLAKPGERVTANSVLARVHAASAVQAESACARILTAFKVLGRAPAAAALVAKILTLAKPLSPNRKARTSRFG
jgi:thymidine phosphorylase